MSSRILAKDATTKPLQFRLHLQNASRANTSSRSNLELRKMMYDPEVLDWLEETLAKADS